MKLVRLDEVIRMIGYSQDWIYRHEKRGDFPKRIRIDKTHVRWNLDDIEKWAVEDKSVRLHARKSGSDYA